MRTKLMIMINKMNEGKTSDTRSRRRSRRKSCGVPKPSPSITSPFFTSMFSPPSPPPPLVVSLSCNHISQAPSPSRPPLSLLLASYSTLNIQDLPCFDPPRAFSCLTPPSRPSISLRCALDSLSPSYTTPERPSLRDTRKVRVYTTSSSTDDPATPDALPLASVPPRNDSSLVAAKRLPGSAGSRRSPLSEAVNIY